MTETFVGRQTELGLIDHSLTVLSDPDRLLQIPILNIAGVEGIGKSAVLQQAGRMCLERDVVCIPNADRQIRDDESSLRQRLDAGEPLVLAIDIPGNTEGELDPLGDSLDRLFKGSGNLFVLIASRLPQQFRLRGIARKVTHRLLKPLEPQEGLALLEHAAPDATSEIRNTMMNWVGGHPLSLDAMAKIVNEGLDPTSAADRPRIVQALTDQVVTERVLARATDPETMHHLLGLLSIPRRFNIPLMQDLVERYLPSKKMHSSLGYSRIPRTLNEVVPGSVEWSSQKAGYAVHDALRPIMSLDYRISKPVQHDRIHGFLAEWSEGVAVEFGLESSDGARYFQEALYHRQMQHQLRTAKPEHVET